VQSTSSIGSSSSPNNPRHPELSNNIESRRAALRFGCTGSIGKPQKKKCPEDVLPMGARSREARISRPGLKAVVNRLELGLELGNISAYGRGILIGD
jgi:hypothetical protein